MTESPQQQPTTKGAGCSPLLAELFLTILVLVVGYSVIHHLEFVEPPPPPFPPNPAQYDPKKAHSPWTKLAILLVTFEYVVILVLAHKHQGKVGVFLLIIFVASVFAVALAFWYFANLEHWTCEFNGHRFVNGGKFVDPKNHEKYGHDFTKAMDENPDALGTLWDRPAINSANTLLGIQYLAVMLFFACSLCLAGDVLYVLIWGKPPGH